MAEPVFVDTLFLNPKWIGTWVENKKEKGGFVRPVIRKTKYGVGPNIVPRKEQVGYAVPEDAIETLNFGRRPVKFVRPPSEIRGQSLEESVLLNQLLEGADRSASEWKQKYKDLQDEMIAKEKELAMLRDEQEEQDKRSDGRDKRMRMLKCNNCEGKFKEEDWEDNGGICPQCNVGEAED